MARSKRTNQELKKRIGKAIHARREMMGITQEKLAEAVGIATETVSRFETGNRLPSIEKLVDIADYFRVPVAVFFETLDDPLAGKSEALARQISALLEAVPASGRKFVLSVAQDYAKYHSGGMRAGRNGED